MEIPKFDQWCSRAVRLIRYSGDRARVFRELRTHLEDHYDNAMSRGPMLRRDPAAALTEVIT